MRTGIAAGGSGIAVVAIWACSEFGSARGPEAQDAGSDVRAPDAEAGSRFCETQRAALYCGDFDDGLLPEAGGGLTVHETFGSVRVDKSLSTSPPGSLLVETNALGGDGGLEAVVGITATFPGLVARGLRLEADVRVEKPCGSPWLMFVLTLSHPDTSQAFEVGLFPGPPAFTAATAFQYFSDGGLEEHGGYDLKWPLLDPRPTSFDHVRLEATFGAVPTLTAWLNGTQTMPVTPTISPFPDGVPGLTLGVASTGTGSACAMRYDNVVFGLIDAP